MRHNRTNLLHTLAAALLLLSPLATGCTDDESALGLDLVDSTTIFNAKTDSLTADIAWSSHEDSLLTSNYSYGIIGNYHDATFGSVSSVLYSQVSLPSNTHDINLMEVTFDSVILTLAKTQLFPDTTGTYHFHFEVMQLAEPVLDTQYYATDKLPVDATGKFFDATVSVAYGDSLVRLHLDTSVNRMLRQSGTANEFKERAKGLRIRITNAGDEGMMSIDFSSAYTCLRAFYHHVLGPDTTFGEYPFLMGANCTHFTNFEHNYSGTVFANADSVPGANTLYLEPLGGYNIRMNFDNALRTFHAAHPTAVVHHAELWLPASSASTTLLPDQVLVMAPDDEGKMSYVDDLVDLYTFQGYDGYYHSNRRAYRMRVTQHMQGLLRNGVDRGWMLVLNSRRNAAERAIFNGTASANPPKIVFVYSE